MGDLEKRASESGRAITTMHSVLSEGGKEVGWKCPTLWCSLRKVQ